MNLSNSRPAVAPGTSALKTATAEQDQQLSADEHAQYRRAVGKLQWMTYTRSDISYATRELARALQQPTTSVQQKLKHLLRYISGTKLYKQVIRPTVKLPEKATPDLNVYVDSNWAGCSTTRKSSQFWEQPSTTEAGHKQHSTIKCRSRALRNQHRSNRSFAHQKPSDGTS